MATQNVTNKIFESAITSIAKSLGDGYKTFGVPNEAMDAISTGHDDLDDLLTKGARGFYLGGIVELMGSESSGKSSVALRTVGNAQKAGHKCCWIDAEASFVPELAILNGCDPEQLLIPDLTSEQGFLNASEILNLIYKTVISNVFGVIVLDSVAALMPDRVLKEDFDPNSAGISELARNLAAQLPKIVQACHKTKTTVIFINQLRDQPGVMYGDRNHTPGGRALKFFAHQRVSIEKIRSAAGQVIISENGTDQIIGHYARVKIIKNKKAPPVINTEIEIPIYFRPYFPDDAKKLYDLSRKLQVVTIRNNELTWKEEDGTIIIKCSGESDFLATIRNDKLEPKLAYYCTIAADGDKNKSKNAPVRMPQTLIDLGKTYSNTPKSDKVETKKKKSAPALEI